MNQRDLDRDAVEDAIQSIQAGLADPTLPQDQRPLWEERLVRLQQVRRELRRWTSREIAIWSFAASLALLLLILWFR